MFKIPHYRILSFIAIGGVAGLAGLIMTITNLDPYESTGVAMPFFFLSAFFTLTSSYTILLFLAKKVKIQEAIGVKHVLVSFRQAILLSVSTLLCMALLILGLLRVWNGLLIVSIITLVEFYLSGRDELT